MIKKILILLYVLVGFVPTLQVVDKFATQMVYLNIVNFLGIIFLVIERKNLDQTKSLNKSIKSPFLVTFFLFIIWSSITTIKSVNITESLRTISDLTSYFTAFTIVISLLRTIKEKGKLITTILVMVLVGELLYIIIPFFNEVLSNTFILGQRSFKGTTGNINIAAFSITIKLPFLFYKIYRSNSLKYFYLFLYLTSLFSIHMLQQTRGAVLANFIIVIALIGLIIFLYITKKKVVERFYLNTFLIISTYVLVLVTSQIVMNTYKGERDTLFSRIESISTEDSAQDRLRYYKEAINTFIENPLLGVGIGQWELKSIETHSNRIKGYIVPYHAHNDYLELLAETGIIGVLLFYGILFFVFIKLITIFYKKKVIEENSLALFIVILALGVYIIDASFNFPFARPIQQMSYFLILALGILSIEKYSHKLNFNFIPSNLFAFILIALLPLQMYSSLKVFNSGREQFFLLGQFNEGNYFQDIDLVESYEDEYPNIMVTTIPIKTMKGIFHIRKNNDFEKAIEYFSDARKENPYLMINETFMGYSYFKLKQMDSAYYYSKLAFEKIPNNPAHFAHYIMTLSERKDTLAIKEAREKIKLINDEVVDEIYYLALAGLLDRDEGKIALDKTSKDLLSSKNDKLKTHIYILEFGKNSVFKAAAFNEIAEEYFNKKKYLEAAENFEAAAKLNNLESSYFENAANAYLQIDRLDKALELIDATLNNINDKNPKALYIKGLIMFQKEEYNQACLLFNRAKTLGLSIMPQLINASCQKAKELE